MIYSAAILWGGGHRCVGSLFSKGSRFGSGRAVGNRMASDIGIPRSVFLILLVNGGAVSGDVLKALEKSKPDLGQASIELGPLLFKGIARIEARFGT